MRTYPKSDPKIEPKSIKKHSRNRCEKREKKGHRKTPQHLTLMVRTIAKPNHFKRHPAEWGARSKYTKRVMRGEYKVECKRWSAERQVQSVSAERQVQTGNPHRDVNTLGGSDHVRISKCLRQNSARGRSEWFLKDDSFTNYMLCIRDDSMISQI